MERFRPLHRSKHRLRYRCECLKRRFNHEAWLNELRAIRGVKNVRLAEAAGSIVFYIDGADIREIEAHLERFDPSRYPLDALDEAMLRQRPPKSGIVRSAGALALAQAVPSDPAKLLFTLLASSPLYRDAIGELFTEGLTSRVLEATAVGVSTARKDYLAANGTNFLLEVGEYIEESSEQRSNELLAELAKSEIREAWVQKKRESGKVETVKVAVEDLKIGDIVVVSTGDTIPVDGHIVEGSATINQVAMTGESEPVLRERGDRVISGTVVVEGEIKIWAEKVGSETATARIREYILATLNEKSSVELRARRLADKLVPVTLGLAGVAWMINRDWSAVASVLQGDYSCALKLATPVAFKSSIAYAGREGILIKGPKAIEALAEADIFVFDKTGTLTYGELEVVSVSTFDEAWSEDDLLNLAASAEEHHFHPIAHAVVEEAKRRGFSHMHHEEVKFIVAHGVQTEVNGKEVLIGSRHFLEEDSGIDFSAHEKKIEACLLEGKTILYVAYDGKLLGTVGMRDRVRENASEVVARLKELGVKKTVMLTGDIEAKARRIAEEAGIDEVYADLKPTMKAQIIERLKSEGAKVAFVGDGINDAPAMSRADVSVCMSKGANIAKVSADIELLKDDIEGVAEAKELAVKTLSLIHANFGATVGINTMILLGAVLGRLSPLATAVLHNGTTVGLLGVSLGGVRLEKERKKRKEKSA